MGRWGDNASASLGLAPGDVAANPAPSRRGISVAPLAFCALAACTQIFGGDSPDSGLSSSSCSDEVKNGTETDRDCGGSCPACSNDSSCSVNNDCRSNLCTDTICSGQACGVGTGSCDDVLGCETDLTTLEDCGSCGRQCEGTVDGPPVCVDGECAIGACDEASAVAFVVDPIDVPDCSAATAVLAMTVSNSCADALGCLEVGPDDITCRTVSNFVPLSTVEEWAYSAATSTWMVAYQLDTGLIWVPQSYRAYVKNSGTTETRSQAFTLANPNSTTTCVP